MPRLRRADCSGPGIRRVKRGRGFGYEDADGRKVEEPEVLTRIAELVIPPAWKDVWICPYPMGHIQATGTDAAGRKQYLYHPQWRVQRDRAKFDDMIAFAKDLPKLRAATTALLQGGEELTRERVLACAMRLLDNGFFRIGSEDYAVTNESYGLATMRKEHVTLAASDTMEFDYPAKSGIRRVQEVVDPVAFDIVAQLKRRRSGGDELLAFKEGRHWRDVKLRRHQRLPQGADRGRPLRQGLPHLERHGARRALPRRRRGGGLDDDRAQACRLERGQDRGRLPRQHARGLPRLLHRSAHHRRLPGRRDRHAEARPAGGRKGSAQAVRACR